MRKPVIDFIANQLAPSDLATVMYPLTPVDAAVLTRNHQGIINTVEKFEGRKYNYEPMNAVEQRLRLQADAGCDRDHPPAGDARRDSRHLHQARLAARRPQVADPDQRGLQCHAAAADAQQHARRLRRRQRRGRRRDRAIRSPATTTSWRIARSSRPSMDMQREMQDVWDACNRNNTAIYAVDPRGLAVGGFDITANISMRTSQNYLNASIDTLRELADNTDGRAIVNRNDLAARHEADHPRLERLLPGRLQLDAGADRRQVPRDQGAGASGPACRSARARATGPTPSKTSSAPPRDRSPARRRKSRRRWRRWRR